MTIKLPEPIAYAINTGKPDMKYWLTNSQQGLQQLNRTALYTSDQVRDILEQIAVQHEANLLNSEDTIELHGIKNGVISRIKQERMPLVMKAKELASGMFGGFKRDDCSDADSCFTCLEQLIKFMQAPNLNITTEIRAIKELIK